MTLAKYVAVLGSYIHNCVFVFKLKRIFKNFLCPPIFFFFFFTERASCSVAHCQSPVYDWTTGVVVWYDTAALWVRLRVVCSLIASTRGLPLNTQDKDRGACLEGQLSFHFFSVWDITFRVLDAQWMQGRYVSCEYEGTCSPAMRTPVSPAQS